MRMKKSQSAASLGLNTNLRAANVSPVVGSKRYPAAPPSIGATFTRAQAAHASAILAVLSQGESDKIRFTVYRKQNGKSGARKSDGTFHVTIIADPIQETL
jgi:hypothetical protein